MHYSEYRGEGQITGIAWSWVGSDEVDCEVLEQDLSNEMLMLGRFLNVYNQADIVTGHYIRKHDLPLLSDHCFRLGLPPLKSIPTSDTMDIVAVKGLGKSQDNLATTLGLPAEKHHMSGADWRIANTLSPEGRAETRKRVTSDVIQHKLLRAALAKRGLLKPPKIWRP